jgi:MFS family permease
VQGLSVVAMFGMFFLGALYLQHVLGYDALQTGLAFLPATLVMAAWSLGYSEKLITRFGARNTLLPGLVLIGAALAYFTQAPVDGSYAVHVLPVMVLLGTGAGIAFPALMTLAMADATPADAGLASGLVNTTVQVGGAIGLAVLATLSASHSKSLVAGGTDTATALTQGYHLAFLIGALVVAAAIVVAVTVLRQPQPARSRPSARPAYSEA